LENGKPSRAAVKRGLSIFAENVRRKRSELYKDFVRRWNAMDVKIALSKIADLSKYSVTLPAGSFGKVALVSDVHGNIEALNTVLADARREGVDLVLSAGDLVGFSPQADKVIDAITDGSAISIKGNFDSELLEWKKSRKGERSLAQHSIATTRKALSKRMRRRLESLPSRLKIRIGDTRILLVHGTPDSPKEHLRSDSPDDRFSKIAKKAGADIVVFGHTHDAMVKDVGGVLFVNPGSVGRPNDGDPRASYAILNLDGLKVEMRRLDYDLLAQARAIRKEGLPEHFAQMLLRGVPLEMVHEQDKASEGWSKENEARLLDSVRAVAKGYDPDPGHSEHVRELSAALFDGLGKLHNLGGRERYWLQCAALLHDSGWSVGGKGHHKHSLEIVLNDQSLPFSIDERLVIGSVARYHRGKLPSPEHFNMAGLDKLGEDIVVKLSSFLRLADGLDAAHDGAVNSVEVSVERRKIRIICDSKNEPGEERGKSEMRTDLMSLAFRMKTSMEWPVRRAQTTKKTARIGDPRRSSKPIDR
jgi:putative phosphoesterase